LNVEVTSIAQVELGASKSDAQAMVCCMLDPELQHKDEDGAVSLQKAAAGQTLALSANNELQVRKSSLKAKAEVPRLSRSLT
jgi:hypothetical protein